jgi:hypothetical protein
VKQLLAGNMQMVLQTLNQGIQSTIEWGSRF